MDLQMFLTLIVNPSMPPIPKLSITQAISHANLTLTLHSNQQPLRLKFIQVTHSILLLPFLAEIQKIILLRLAFLWQGVDNTVECGVFGGWSKQPLLALAEG